MNSESAVQFATESRTHIALAVKNVEQSIAFYRTLFGQEPTKTKPGYAKFEVAEPPVNLALNQTPGQTGPSNPVAHFGIQLKSTAAVKTITERLVAGGLVTKPEENVTCCYAVQNKVWVADPDGNNWEVYVLLDDDGAHYHTAAQSTCCPDVSSQNEPVARGSFPATMTAFQQIGQSGGCCSSQKSKQN